MLGKETNQLKDQFKSELETENQLNRKKTCLAWRVNVPSVYVHIRCYITIIFAREEKETENVINSTSLFITF